MKGLIGKKLGMTHVFVDGRMVPVTVVEAGPCKVLALRTQERNGYSAVQLGFGKRKAKNVSKAVRTHAEAAGYEQAPELIREIRLTSDPSEDVGQTLSADLFAEGEYVDVVGTTRGKGFQGVVRRYNFGGGRASHGGAWTRRTGSIGMCVNPGKVYKGRKMPGQMGNKRRTVQNLVVVAVRPDDNVLLIKGAIPGAPGGQILIRQAVKKQEVAK